MRHFAFENGLGVCLALPQDSPETQLPQQTRLQILARMREATHAWFRQGEAYLRSQSVDRETSLRRMVVDRSLFDEANDRFEFRADQFGFVTPTRMAYEPSPTTLVCGKCGLLRPCRDVNEMLAHLRAATLQCKHPKHLETRPPSSCDWRQFEPILVHPSGSWRPAGTDTLDRDPATGDIYRRHAICESCGSTEFEVDTKKVTLGGWFLKCARCGVKRNVAWTDHDEEYLRLQPFPGVTLEDARMEKISYGAAVAFSPHAETFVDLPEGDALKVLESHRLVDLHAFLARRCGYVAVSPQPEAAAEILERRGGEANAIATRIRSLLGVVAKLGGPGAPGAADLLELARAAVAEALDRDLIQTEAALPYDLSEAARTRSEVWASRYDPFRLAVEHRALTDTKLSGRQESGRASYVPFATPDERLSPWRNDPDEAAGSPRLAFGLRFLGISDAGLVPQFELCRFTYGYSRTSSTPAPQRPTRRTPVRLTLFPKTTVGDAGHVHPVYVLRQKNEAFYFRLDEGRVRDWLTRLSCVDADMLGSEPSLAGALLRSSAATPMDRFLTRHDRGSPNEARPCTLYAASYALLHSMAHHVIRTMARLSGLDEGGLGEYLFPVDLAFVVYRSGMTMDLGDLSSLWRNSWEPFINELCRYQDSLGCNVGSLCAEQGGACPDCLMVPEVCCLAGNRYLSRSLMTGEGVPSFMDIPDGRVTGFLEIARGES
jgi:hypothetical protein